MRWLILSIGVVLCVTIQSTWLAALHLPAQVTPDLVLIMAISYGLLRGPDTGLLFGLGAGLFMDLVSGGLIGVQALSKMAAGFFAGFMEKNIFKDNLLVPVIATFIGTLVCESFNILMYMAFNSNYQFFNSFFMAILPLAFFNALLAPVVYHLLLRMEHHFNKE